VFLHVAATCVCVCVCVSEGDRNKKEKPKPMAWSNSWLKFLRPLFPSQVRFCLNNYGKDNSNGASYKNKNVKVNCRIDLWDIMGEGTIAVECTHKSYSKYNYKGWKVWKILNCKSKEEQVWKVDKGPCQWIDSRYEVNCRSRIGNILYWGSLLASKYSLVISGFTAFLMKARIFWNTA
jgi:hypothetical protein